MNELDKYYAALDLKPGASEDEIKQAYEDLVNIWNPERVSSNPRLQERANEKLKEVNSAYEKLMEHIVAISKEPPPATGGAGTGSEEQRHSDDQPPSEPPTETTTGQTPGVVPKRKGVKKAFLFGAIALALLIGISLFYFLFLGHPSRQVLAKVNDEKIMVEQFNNEVAKVEDPLREMFREEPLQFLEGMIVRKLLLQEAKKQGLSAPVKTYKDTGKDSLPPEEALIAELMKKRLSSLPAVTREEIEAFYSMFKGKMEGRPLKEVAPVIEQIIQEGKQQEEMGRFVEDLRKSAKVEIDQERVKKISVKPPETNTDEEFKKATTDGKPAMVSFGANSCMPCRQLRPILKEIGQELTGKAKILVIDVYKYQNLAKDYKIQLLPTLVFFDPKGKEVFRHVGVMDKKGIVDKLKEIGMTA